MHLGAYTKCRQFSQCMTQNYIYREGENLLLYKCTKKVYNLLISMFLIKKTNQKFIVLATLRIVGNRWLWSIMLGNANEARKFRVGYRRLPTEFLILETQLQATMIIVGIFKCTQHVCESCRNFSHLRW